LNAPPKAWTHCMASGGASLNHRQASAVES
jgi:hypothetical protein